jgi:hypothetical protein
MRRERGARKAPRKNLERFQAKGIPVGVKKTRKTKGRPSRKRDRPFWAWRERPLSLDRDGGLKCYLEAEGRASLNTQ